VKPWAEVMGDVQPVDVLYGLMGEEGGEVGDGSFAGFFRDPIDAG
jgi:hypothetical protein